MRTLMLALAALLAWAGWAAAGVVDDLQQESVMVRCGTQAGSGVVFRNGDTCFVWTAAHVLESGQKVSTGVDPKTGLPRVTVTYEDVLVVQPDIEGGRKVGERTLHARVVRYSDAGRGGEDLALLRVYKHRAFRRGVTFLDGKTIPRPGEALWHVGSMSGQQGMNSTADGVFSLAGRLRRDFQHNETSSPKVYDQIMVPALCGSSGGGVFLKSNGQCIGLLTEGLYGAYEAPNCIVPARRIREFARRTACEYAVDARVKVPEEVDDRTPTDRDVPVPPDWPGLRAPAPPPRPRPSAPVPALPPPWLPQLLTPFAPPR